MSFVAVMPLKQLWAGDMVGTIVNQVRVLLIRQDDQIYAYENRCVHLGVLLSEGRLEKETLTCKAHEYQYDARTGKGINPRDVCLRSFAVQVVNDEIYVDVDQGI